MITPKSAFASKLQSDTIFGHICWAIKYIYGENVLLRFLDGYSTTNPPLILSDGIPDGYLPMPVLRPLGIQEREALFNEFFEDNKSDRVLFASALKRLKKQPYISMEALDILKDRLSYYNLYRLVFQQRLCPQNFILMSEVCQETGFWGCPVINYTLDPSECPYRVSITQPGEVYRNRKNRLSDTVEEGGLFLSELVFYQKRIIIYIKEQYLGISKIKSIFEFISISGFGADKSIGRGRFIFELKEGYTLPVSSTSNGFLLLSSYFPYPSQDPLEGYYEVITKFGKLGGDWASGNPYKQPLLMIKSGGVFFDTPVKEYYGGLIPNVHRNNPRIVQYGYGFPLGVKIL
jgi:CRISPR-associated protein Csm4